MSLKERHDIYIYYIIHLDECSSFSSSIIIIVSTLLISSLFFISLSVLSSLLISLHSLTSWYSYPSSHLFLSFFHLFFSFATASLLYLPKMMSEKWTYLNECFFAFILERPNELSSGPVGMLWTQRWPLQKNPQRSAGARYPFLREAKRAYISVYILQNSAASLNILHC